MSRAQQRWPTTDLQALQAGRDRYVRKCSGCHALYAPASRAPDQWPGLITQRVLEQDAGSSEEYQALISRFLAAMAERRVNAE